MEGKNVVAAVGALLAVVFQVLLAPNIAIMDTMPNFVVAYVMALALLLPGTPIYLIAFFAGLACDLVGYGPVGALPFILLVVAFAADRAQSMFGNGTLFVSCAMLIVFVLIVHFLHAAFMVAVTSTYTAADAFVLVAIPQALYDSVIAVGLYVLLRRVFAPAFTGSSAGSDVPNLRLR